MAKKNKSSKTDFITTIEDGDKVQDLDNDTANAEMNPDFHFDADGFDFEDEVELSENDLSEEEDQLDAILRKHGGLENAENNVLPVAEEEDKGETSEEENGDEENSNDEPEKEEEKEEATVTTDKSGFFEDAEVSTTIPFAKMNLSRPVLKGISEANYTAPTPIQSAVIPVSLLGKDIVAGAVTGSGKTAAYLIPTLERLVYRPTKTAATRVVILTPTRELAMQVFEVGQQLGKFIPHLNFGLAVGGLSLRQQEMQLRSKPDVVVATPGRFIDHVRNSPSFNVDDVEVLVLDEADRMLEEGFESEVTEILRLIPAKRQTLLFSATMNSSVQDLVKLSLKKPVRLMLNPPKQAAKGLVQEFVRIRKQHEGNRPAVLVNLLRKLLAGQSNKRVIVFVAQKRTAHKLRIVCGLLGIRVGELHGSLTQEQRISSISQFKSLEVPVLICTDLASRGLDIPKIEVVINYELPSTYDVYLHRIGRSARAGRTGTAVSFVGESTSERQLVKSAISANAAAKQKILGRNVNWDEIKTISEEIETKEKVVDEVLEEEKTVKELSTAEKELERAENLVKHREEIKARPKRTWFESNSEKNSDLSRKRRKQLAAPKSNSQKKRLDKNRAATEGAWAYKKTKGDRKVTAQRGANKKIMKDGVRKLKSK